MSNKYKNLKTFNNANYWKAIPTVKNDRQESKEHETFVAVVLKPLASLPFSGSVKA